MEDNNTKTNVANVVWNLTLTQMKFVFFDFFLDFNVKYAIYDSKKKTIPYRRIFP